MTIWLVHILKAENKEGLHFAWFTGGRNKGCFYTQSASNGNGFIQPDRISQMGSHPQISSMPGGELAVVWDESVRVNNKYYKRIGVQKKTPNGMNKVQAFVTPDTLTATYPEIQSAVAGHTLIANTLNKANYVTFQRINFQ